MAKYPYDCLKFVWRQSEFAFFGALASVGALFYFAEKNTASRKTMKETKPKYEQPRLTITTFEAADIMELSEGGDGNEGSWMPVNDPLAIF